MFIGSYRNNSRLTIPIEKESGLEHRSNPVLIINY